MPSPSADTTWNTIDVITPPDQNQSDVLDRTRQSLVRLPYSTLDE